MQRKIYNLIIIDESGFISHIATPVVSGLMQLIQQKNC
jgi:hypothetical protein